MSAEHFKWICFGIPELAGLMVAVGHYSCVACCAVSSLLLPVGSTAWIIGVTWALGSIIGNVIFQGCCVLKVERHLIGREWVGFYDLLNDIGLNADIPTIMKVHAAVTTISLSYIAYRVYRFYNRST